MVEMKYFLLILGICALQLVGSLAENTACASILWGRKTPYLYKSPDSIIPAGQKTFYLSIYDGTNVCSQYGLKFVGEEVVVCDSDVPPYIYFVNPADPTLVEGTRNGKLLFPATAHTNYYCDTYP